MVLMAWSCHRFLHSSLSNIMYEICGKIVLSIKIRCLKATKNPPCKSNHYSPFFTCYWHTLSVYNPSDQNSCLKINNCGKTMNLWIWPLDANLAYRNAHNGSETHTLCATCMQCGNYIHKWGRLFHYTV